MLTGDRRRAAEVIAREVGIPNVEAELLPEQKLERVRQLASQGRVVAMVGDGVNDAPALAAAHVGIAVSGASDITAEAADVVYLGAFARKAAQAVRSQPARRGHGLAEHHSLRRGCSISSRSALAATGMLWPIGAAFTHQLVVVLRDDELAAAAARGAARDGSRRQRLWAATLGRTPVPAVGRSCGPRCVGRSARHRSRARGAPARICASGLAHRRRAGAAVRLLHDPARTKWASSSASAAGSRRPSSPGCITNCPGRSSASRAFKRAAFAWSRSGSAPIASGPGSRTGRLRMERAASLRPLPAQAGRIADAGGRSEHDGGQRRRALSPGAAGRVPVPPAWMAKRPCARRPKARCTAVATTTSLDEMLTTGRKASGERASRRNCRRGSTATRRRRGAARAAAGCASVARSGGRVPRSRPAPTKRRTA